MKRIVAITILPIYLLSTSLSNKEITVMVDKIKEERGGIGVNILDTTPNPFAIVKEVIKSPKEVKIKKPKEVTPKISYELTAILNHRAFINKKWYRVGDKLDSFIVHSIGARTVILKNREEIKKIVIKRREKKFKIFKGN
jgi:hypothetical protein